MKPYKYQRKSLARLDAMRAYIESTVHLGYRVNARHMFYALVRKGLYTDDKKAYNTFLSLLSVAKYGGDFPLAVLEYPALGLLPSRHLENDPRVVLWAPANIASSVAHAVSTFPAVVVGVMGQPSIDLLVDVLWALPPGPVTFVGVTGSKSAWTLLDAVMGALDSGKGIRQLITQDTVGVSLDISWLSLMAPPQIEQLEIRELYTRLQDIVTEYTQ